MTKTKPEIAKAILERRNRMTHVIMPGDINAAIGPDGVAEALKERWLVPDTDSGFLCATNDLVKVEEMRKIAQVKPEDYKPEPILVTEGHDLSLLHTNRRRSLNEIAAPATGKDSPGLGAIAQPQSHDQTPSPASVMPQPQPPAAPQAPAPVSAPAAGGFGIGSPVMVARNGIQAHGMIEKLLPNGQYEVGFPAGQPNTPPGNNVYSKDEVSSVPNGTQNQPVTTT